jgi:hypothetical protein
MEDFMQNVTTTRRPLGITIIAILLFIQAVFEIVERTLPVIDDAMDSHARATYYGTGDDGQGCNFTRADGKWVYP